MVHFSGTHGGRRRVPKHLVEKLGKKVVLYSLETADLKVARRKREVADLEWSARFAACEDTRSTPDVPKASPVALSPAALKDLVVRHVERMDARFRVALTDDPPESAAQAAEMIQNVVYDLQVVTNRDDPRGDHVIHQETGKLLQAAGSSIDTMGPKYPESPSWCAEPS